MIEIAVGVCLGLFMRDAARLIVQSLWRAIDRWDNRRSLRRTAGSWGHNRWTWRVGKRLGLL